jgi:hypothetical protein
MSKRPEVIELAQKGHNPMQLLAKPMPDFSGARCVGANTDLFFSEEKREIAAAKNICRECEIASDCLSWAAAEAPEGIFGGLTGKERALLFGTSNFVLDRIGLADDARFILQASLSDVAIKFGVDERTALRWRNSLKQSQEAA